MDLKNKELAGKLLCTLEQIENAKFGSENIGSNNYTSKDWTFLGMCLHKITYLYPNFREDFRNFLDKESEDINTQLSKL